MTDLVDDGVPDLVTDDVTVGDVDDVELADDPLDADPVLLGVLLLVIDPVFDGVTDGVTDFVGVLDDLPSIADLPAQMLFLAIPGEEERLVPWLGGRYSVQVEDGPRTPPDLLGNSWLVYRRVIANLKPEG